MSIVEYLESEEAVRDVAALLGHARRLNGGTTDSPAGWLEFDDGAWRVVKWENLHAYYRPEGDRYVVTDLGEAVRALRLRTCLTPHEADVAASRVLMEMLRYAPRWWVPNTCVGSAIEIPHGVPAADLPRALVRVMLAAHRVAALEVP